MTLIINPPVQAIPVYPWIKAQDFYTSILEIVRAAQFSIDPDYDFEITKNKFLPKPQRVNTDKLVNINFGDIRDIQQHRHGKEIIVPFLFEFWASASETAANSADEIVIEKAQYLSAMVEYGITALYNHDDPQLQYGTMDRGTMTRSFGVAEEVLRSNELYASGVLKMDVRFVYSHADYSNLPNLEFIKTQIDDRIYDFKANII